MKTVVIYSSKKGCTEKCATYIKNKSNAELYHVKKFKEDISEYDNVIILSPTYMGTINKNIKAFIMDNEKALLKKNVSFGLVGMNVTELENTITLNFTESFINHAEIRYVGGGYNFEKLNFFQKAIIKKVAGVSESLEDIKYDVLDTLISK